MTNLIIDKEFKNLIPPLSDEEFSQLEENILRDGIQDPLKVWQGTLIDGHNRYAIARKHNLDFSITPIDFVTRDDAIVWIIKNQLGRRNLPAPVRIKLALIAEPLIAKQAKENSLANLKQNSESDICPTRQSETETPKKDWKDKQKTSTNYKLAEMAGVSDKTVQRYKKIQQSAPDDLKTQVDKGEISINEGYQKVTQAERKKEIQKQVEEIEQKAVEQPDGLFDVIVIDPPWGYGTQFLAEAYRAANPYPEMSQDDLKKIELPAAENCVLFLWTTNKFIWDAKELLDTWKFDYRCMLIWNKQQMGMGNLIRMQCEFCLMAFKGKPVFKDVHDLRDLIEEPRREHSRKPEKFYELVEKICAGRKLDYFSREQREGWSNFGNDTNKFNVA